jgi:hypothetical protein
MYKITRKNYFTKEWAEKFPLAKENFDNWLAVFKTDIMWNELFVNLDESRINYPVYPKFQDIPVELQFGILMRYFEQHGYSLVWSPDNNYVAQLNWNFSGIEKILTARG